MIILGIDPGTQVTGYGLIQKDAPRLIALDYGCIRPPAALPLCERYRIIYESLSILIDKHRPDAMAIESQFILKNPQSAIKLGMAKGMAILAATQRGVPIFEYAPTRAKRAVVGHGHASKWQVQKMIQTILRLPSVPEPEDAADALSLAICHAQTKDFTSCMNQFGARSRTKRRIKPSLNATGSATASQLL
ncbi:MAG: ruvC [Parachlamydiales bacterium]|nr:ruvC [Parachlamydiales bacterium]